MEFGKSIDGFVGTYAPNKSDQTAIGAINSQLAELVNRAQAIQMRLGGSADRLLGSVPTAGEAGGNKGISSVPSGHIDEMRGYIDQIATACRYSEQYLERIEGAF